MLTPIPVRIRLDWARDGEEFADGLAVEWVGRKVRVRYTDPRRLVGAIWLRAEDVRRVQ